jgi:hypothetical protein
MASTSCYVGFLFYTTYSYKMELVVINSTFTNIRCGGSDYGVDFGFFKISTSTGSSWYIIEVRLFLSNNFFFF